ncbi:hypothetical protein RHGRI_001324 [Rhododendron griersonianum]|uniref:SWIM-type domain-containing protein n=1 Tax=Rhododendron griersonianum TaxID=479676 RepID=A0AAV6LL17_9ERIC|nr:hypothetical protein RHGRI_001324 [Rhododendron griersonianum]
MNAKTCTCRRWDLTSIPCAHALVVLRDSKKKAEGLVHYYYQKQAYINTYKHVIYPMNGMDMWEKTNKPPIEPPHYTRNSRRPKKCRMREPDEPPAQSDGTKLIFGAGFVTSSEQIFGCFGTGMQLIFGAGFVTGLEQIFGCFGIGMQLIFGAVLRAELGCFFGGQTRQVAVAAIALFMLSCFCSLTVWKLL